MTAGKRKRQRMTGKNNTASLPLAGHLEELRRRIFYCLGFILAGTLVSFPFAGRIIDILRLPASGIIETLVFLKPTGMITAYFRVALYAGVVISSPALFYHFWKFIKPALGSGGNMSVINWFFTVLLLFLLGTAFAYMIAAPLALNFLLGFSEGTAEPTITLNYYIAFIITLLVLSGIVFEMPVIAAFLTMARLLTPAVMRRRRREALFALFVTAAVATPTTDIFNMLVFVTPMIILYEASILVSAVIYRALKITPPLSEVYPNET